MPEVGGVLLAAGGRDKETGVLSLVPDKHDKEPDAVLPPGLERVHAEDGAADGRVLVHLLGLQGEPGPLLVSDVGVRLGHVLLNLLVLDVVVAGEHLAANLAVPGTNAIGFSGFSGVIQSIIMCYLSRYYSLGLIIKILCIVSSKIQPL